MTTEQRPGRIPSKEQLRLPRRLRADEGDVIEVVLKEGVARITFGKTIEEIQVEVEKFKPDKAAQERALRAFERRLVPFVQAKLTEAGAQYVAPDEISFAAQIDWKQQEDAIRKSMGSLLNQGIQPLAIDNELRGLVLGKSGVPEFHMGIPHPSLRNVLTDLQALLHQVVEERQEKRLKVR